MRNKSETKDAASASSLMEMNL